MEEKIFPHQLFLR